MVRWRGEEGKRGASDARYDEGCCVSRLLAVAHLATRHQQQQRRWQWRWRLRHQISSRSSALIHGV